MIILNEFCNLNVLEVFCLIFLVCLVLCFVALIAIAWKDGCNAGCGYETWENKHLEHVYYDIIAPITLVILIFNIGMCFALCFCN